MQFVYESQMSADSKLKCVFADTVKSLTETVTGLIWFFD